MEITLEIGYRNKYDTSVQTEEVTTYYSDYAYENAITTVLENLSGHGENIENIDICFVKELSS